MNDQVPMKPGLDQKLDSLLHKAFVPNQTLSAEFDQKVMAFVERQTRQSKNGRVVSFTMMVYWAAASLTGAWLWFDVSSGDPAGVVPVRILLSLTAMITMGMYLLLRQSRLKLSDLFLGTIQ